MGRTIRKVGFAFHAFKLRQRALRNVIRAHAALKYLELAIQAGYKEAAELLMKAHGKLALFNKAEYKSESFG